MNDVCTKIFITCTASSMHPNGSFRRICSEDAIMIGWWWSAMPVCSEGGEGTISRMCVQSNIYYFILISVPNIWGVIKLECCLLPCQASWTIWPIISRKCDSRQFSTKVRKSFLRVKMLNRCGFWGKKGHFCGEIITFGWWMITFEGPQCMWTNPSKKFRQGSDPTLSRQCLYFGNFLDRGPSLRGKLVPKNLGQVGSNCICQFYPEALRVCFPGWLTCGHAGMRPYIELLLNARRWLLRVNSQ